MILKEALPHKKIEIPVFVTIVNTMKNTAQDKLTEKQFNCLESLLFHLLDDTKKHFEGSKEKPSVDTLFKQINLIEDYLDAIPNKKASQE